MGMEFQVDSLEDMCALMCDNVIPERRSKMTLNEIICANVRYLAKKNKMLIGEVEESVNLCRGYFSRKNKDDSSIPIDKIYLVAQIFQVSMDDMCSNIPLRELEETAKEYGYKLVPIDEVEE